MQKNNLSSLQISGWKVWISLGCSEQERYHPQPVSLDIKVTFHTNLVATKSDNLKDTVCYADAVELITKRIKSKSYNLIEYLAADMHNLLFSSFKEKKIRDVSLSITVTKLSSPVPDIHGGISFTYHG